MKKKMYAEKSHEEKKNIEEFQKAEYISRVRRYAHHRETNPEESSKLLRIAERPITEETVSRKD